MMHRRTFTAGALAALLPWQVRPSWPVPTASQLAWQQDELALFLHFGVNTFSDREWGDGTESPAIFAPSALDARQWARAARASGFRALILTAKHHDGFCLWPSRTTTHSVARSPWRSGGGDLVREFVDACRLEGLKPGLYCSPWDRNSPVYGDSPRYNDLFMEQLTELLTGYGPIHEVWFDGANGEGPNGKKQVYDWPRTFGLVKRLMPDAVIFSDAGPDIRWIGNETGSAGNTNWSTVDPAAVPYPGADGPGIIAALQQGSPTGTVWRPGETDVSIRPGWFYHPAEDGRVRSADNLLELYFSSVGRNSKLLLNVPPNREGLLHDVDVSRLAAMRESREARFATDLVAGGAVRWRQEGRGGTAEVRLARRTAVQVVALSEDIVRGQAVAGYVVEGESDQGWVELALGTTIGYKKLHKVGGPEVRRVRVRVRDAVHPPGPLSISLY
jgi:alpha-L-fucosidase